MRERAALGRTPDAQVDFDPFLCILIHGVAWQGQCGES